MYNVQRNEPVPFRQILNRHRKRAGREPAKVRPAAPEQQGAIGLLHKEETIERIRNRIRLLTSVFRTGTVAPASGGRARTNTETQNHGRELSGNKTIVQSERVRKEKIRRVLPLLLFYRARAGKRNASGAPRNETPAVRYTTKRRRCAAQRNAGGAVRNETQAVRHATVNHTGTCGETILFPLGIPSETGRGYGIAPCQAGARPEANTGRRK